MAIDIRSIAEFSNREPDFYISRVPGCYFSDAGTIIKMDMWANSIQEWYNHIYADIVNNCPKANVIIAGFDVGLILQTTTWCQPCVRAMDFFDENLGKWHTSWIIGTHGLFIDDSFADDAFIVARIEDDTVYNLFVGKLL